MSDDPLTASARIPERLQASADQPLELVEEEVEIFGLFLALATQWRRCPFTGSRLGLDYSVIEATARMLDIEMTPGLLTDLTIMEAAALEQLAKRR